MIDVAVIEDPAAAGVSLDPVRARLLAALAEPGSATTLAAQVGLTRQKANYHLRARPRARARSAVGALAHRSRRPPRAGGRRAHHARQGRPAAGRDLRDR